MKINKIYEKYHSERKLQKHIINATDFTYKSLLDLLIKYCQKRGKVLDIGCGVGTIDFYLAERGHTVVAIDISENAISIARRNAKIFGLDKYMQFYIGNFPEEIPKGIFDTIICSEILEHIKDDKGSVKKIKESLRKNGIVIASSPSQKAPLFKMGLLKNFDREVGHLRRYTDNSYRELFESAGLKILEIKKNEGILRSLLFTNKIGSLALRVINKWPFSVVFTFFDDLTIPIFGESDIIIVAQKK